jgi:hypothetical protein
VPIAALMAAAADFQKMPDLCKPLLAL